MFDFKEYHQFIQNKAKEPLPLPIQSNIILLPFLDELTNQPNSMASKEPSITQADAVQFEKGLTAIFSSTTLERSLMFQLNTLSIEEPLISDKKIFSSKSKEDDFVREVAEIATSDEIISALSNELGSPKEEETENDFVNRGKNILRKILRETFNQK